MEDGLAHKDALKIAEKIAGPARSGEEKIVISEEAIVEEMAILDNEEEQEEEVVAMVQESGVTITDEC